MPKQSFPLRYFHRWSDTVATVFTYQDASAGTSIKIKLAKALVTFIVIMLFLLNFVASVDLLRKSLTEYKAFVMEVL